MFKDFKYQRTEEYATWRVLSSFNNLEYYKTALKVLKPYNSGIVFPEQLLGFNGNLYCVRLNTEPKSQIKSVEVYKLAVSRSVSKHNGSLRCIETDDEVIQTENNNLTIYLYNTNYHDPTGCMFITLP